MEKRLKKLVFGIILAAVIVAIPGSFVFAAPKKVYVQLEGGSGRAKYEKTATYMEKDGRGTAEFVFKSPCYTWMKVGGAEVPAKHTDETSTFEVPVEKLGVPVEVVTENTKMSRPHEITYTLTFTEEEATTQESTKLSDSAEKKIAERKAEVKREKAEKEAAAKAEEKKISIIILAIVLGCLAVVEAKSLGRKHHDDHHRHN